MDPNAVLAKIRAAVEESFTVSDCSVDDIAEAFQALDEWLSKGGFLPAAWRHAHPMDWLDEIHALLSGNPWNADTLDGVAGVLNRAGYEVLEPEPLKPANLPPRTKNSMPNPDYIAAVKQLKEASDGASDQ